MKQFILILATALSTCAEPVLADPVSSAGDMARAYGMSESFATPIDPATHGAAGQRILAPSPLEGTLSGGLMDQGVSPGAYQVVGDRFIVITLNDGRTLTVDTLNPNSNQQGSNGVDVAVPGVQ